MCNSRFAFILAFDEPWVLNYCPLPPCQFERHGTRHRRVSQPIPPPPPSFGNFRLSWGFCLIARNDSREIWERNGATEAGQPFIHRGNTQVDCRLRGGGWTRQPFRALGVARYDHRVPRRRTCFNNQLSFRFQDVWKIFQSNLKSQEIIIKITGTYPWYMINGVKQKKSEVRRRCKVFYRVVRTCYQRGSNILLTLT